MGTIIKKASYFTLVTILVIIVLPMFVVKCFNFNSAGNTGQKAGNERQEQKYDNNGTGNKRGNSATKMENKAEEREIKIKVYIAAEDKIKDMDLEEYVKGVVAAEMPAEFADEALKAQAVAARTYVYGRIKGLYIDEEDTAFHRGAHICTDYTHCQAWVSKDEAMAAWDSAKAEDYWAKIEKAVNETKGTIILYNGVVANTLFHSNSGGRTENVEEVWNVNPVGYLRSVASEGEENSPSYMSVLRVSTDEFYNILKENYPDAKLNKNNILGDVKILDYTTGGRVKTMQIGNILIKGTDFRKIFSLTSANITLKQDNSGMIEITTYGSGHGVGMSQWGANYLAKTGKGWVDIIKHYYIGVELGTIG